MREFWRNLIDRSHARPSIRREGTGRSRAVWGMAVGVAVLLQTTLLSAAEETKWRIEAEAAEVGRHQAVKVVDDAQASGGKAIEVPAAGVPDWNVVSLGLPTAMTPGRYKLVAHLKAANLADLGKAWRFDIREDAKLLGYAVAYGCYLRGQTGYQDFVVPFEWNNPGRRPALYMRWTTGEGKPAVRLDYFDVIRVGDLPAVRIQRVWPDRLRYLRRQDGEIAVTIASQTKQPVHGKVRLELTHDLDRPESLGEQAFTVEPGQAATVKFPFRNKGLLFGYAAKAALIVDGQAIESREEYFTVHDNPWAVATGAHDAEPGDYATPWWGYFYGIGATDPLIDEAVRHAREEYTTCTEFFSWSPGEAFDLAPDKEFWIRGNGGDLLRSKRELQREVAGLKQYGIGCITYIAYQAMGERALEIFRKTPEWFTYSPLTGDVLEFYNLDQLEKRKEFWRKFDWDKYQSDGNPVSPGWKDTPESWKRYEEFWRKPAEECRKLGIIGYFAPNYMLPEVVDYCADQVIASAKMFGWDGLRWDCGHLNPGPIWGTFQPFVDFQGNPQAQTPAEMEKRTVSNLQRLKARVRAQIPNFVIGSNYGSWMETHTNPQMVKELARDGGWLLDEFSYAYNEPQSPYHFWEAYYAIMADEGEHITSQGGHYNPFAFNRGGGKYPVDGLYETVFRIVGHGHPNSIYFNSQTPFGNFAQFCVRFGQFMFDPAIRRIAKPEAIVSVRSSAPLWWNKTVGRLKDRRRDFLIVHLINPPVAKAAETDPLSTLPAPVNQVTVTVQLPAGNTHVTAWGLSAESWTTAEPPRTQAIALRATVTGDHAAVVVPQILCWKAVVFRFE